MLALLREELDAGTGGAGHLPTAAWHQLDVMDDRAGRHFRQGQAVAHANVGVRPRLHRGADPQPLWREDVALLPVGVVQQRDVRGAVGVVLDLRHPRGDAILAPLEIDLPVQPLGTAAAMPRCLPSARIAPAGLGQAFGQ